MPASHVHRILFDAARLEHGIDAWMNAAIEMTPWVGFIYEGRVTQITSSEDIKRHAKRWPHWVTLPWIIVGAEVPPSSFRTYIRPFIDHRPSAEYDQHVDTILEDFEWAIFTYFTTFQDEIYTWVSRLPRLDSAAPSLLQDGVTLDRYTEGARYLQTLKNATFYDEGNEGKLAYDQALKRGEPLPFLLCQIEPDEPWMYWREGPEPDDGIGTDWFAEHVAQLELVEEFDCEYVVSYTETHVYRTQFRLYRVTNLEAYFAIWAQASRDWSIAMATLAADCAITNLKVKLSVAPNLFDVVRDTETVAAWAYGQIYGGGADEHHAVFHARDAAITHEIWNLAGKSGISRF